MGEITVTPKQGLMYEDYTFSISGLDRSNFDQSFIFFGLSGDPVTEFQLSPNAIPRTSSSFATTLSLPPLEAVKVQIIETSTGEIKTTAVEVSVKQKEGSTWKEIL